MLTPPQLPVTNFGMDSYAGNDLPADFASSKYSLAFIIHKATEGTYHQDSAFPASRKAIEQAGIPFGAYHFCSGENDVEAQVDNFLNVVKPPYPLLALDWEKTKTAGVMSSAQARQFLQLVKQKTGITPLVYGSNYVTDSDAASTYDPVFAQARLWLASPYPYSGEKPLPDGAKPPFTRTLASWPSILIWQYTSDDAGYAKPAFADHFDGADFNQIAVADLQAWPFHDPVVAK
jgi:lysozyme